MEIDTGNRSSLHIIHPESGPRKRERPSLIRDFSNVQRNIRTFGRGIFKAPLPRPSAASSPSSTTATPEIPPRHLSDRLLNNFIDSFHKALPILRWQSFHEQYDRVYREGSLKSMPRVWGALFFAILACGSLNDPLTDGQYFLETSRDLTDLWAEDYTLDHVRCALFSSIYLSETNATSAAWTLLGYATRVAQDIGLHREIASSSIGDVEMQRRIWWSILASER